jgi:hypothetical protein
MNNTDSISTKMDSLKEKLKKLFFFKEKCDALIHATKEELAELFAINISIFVGHIYTVTYDEEKYKCKKTIIIKVTRFYCTNTYNFCVVGEDKNGIEWWFYPEIECTFREASLGEYAEFEAEQIDDEGFD